MCCLYEVYVGRLEHDVLVFYDHAIHAHTYGIEFYYICKIVFTTIELNPHPTHLIIQIEFG